MSTKTYNYLVIIFLLTIISGSSIQSNSIPNSYIFSKDKLLHIIEYFFLGFLLSNSIISKTHFPVLLCFFLGMFFAIIDEIYQSTVIGRFPSSFDVIANLVGLTLSILYFKLITRISINVKKSFD